MLPDTVFYVSSIVLSTETRVAYKVYSLVVQRNKQKSHTNGYKSTKLCRIIEGDEEVKERLLQEHLS
jgi:hypothetical protein